MDRRLNYVLHPVLKVRGLGVGGSAPQLLAEPPPQLRGSGVVD